MGNSGLVQLVHLGPQPHEQVICDLAGRKLLQRAAVHPVQDQQRGIPAGHDDTVDAGHPYAGPLRHDAGQGLVLDCLEERRGRPGVPDTAQASEPVCPVEQVSVPLIGADGLDEQRAAVLGDGCERPRALRLHGGRRDGADLQAGGAGRVGDAGGRDPPVWPAERDQPGGAQGDPGGECECHGDRLHRAGDQQRHTRCGERDPGRPAPGAAQPG